jgi:archaellum component FlaF (FlaF/FlaG flagellin family)
MGMSVSYTATCGLIISFLCFAGVVKVKQR